MKSIRSWYTPKAIENERIKHYPQPNGRILSPCLYFSQIRWYLKKVYWLAPMIEATEGWSTARHMRVIFLQGLANSGSPWHNLLCKHESDHLDSLFKSTFQNVFSTFNISIGATHNLLYHLFLGTRVQLNLCALPEARTHLNSIKVRKCLAAYPGDVPNTITHPGMLYYSFRSL